VAKPIYNHVSGLLDPAETIESPNVSSGSGRVQQRPAGAGIQPAQPQQHALGVETEFRPAGMRMGSAPVGPRAAWVLTQPPPTQPWCRSWSSRACTPSTTSACATWSTSPSTWTSATTSSSRGRSSATWLSAATASSPSRPRSTRASPTSTPTSTPRRSTPTSSSRWASRRWRCSWALALLGQALLQPHCGYRRSSCAGDAVGALSWAWRRLSRAPPPPPLPPPRCCPPSWCPTQRARSCACA
jgi:hypothetical protein